VGILFVVYGFFEGSMLYCFICFVIGLEHPLSTPINFIIHYSKKKQSGSFFIFGYHYQVVLQNYTPCVSDFQCHY